MGFVPEHVAGAYSILSLDSLAGFWEGWNGEKGGKEKRG